MKRTFASVSLLLMLAFAAHSQKNNMANNYIDTVGNQDVIFDDKPIGLGVEVVDNQTFVNQSNPNGKVTTAKTVLTVNKNNRGELYLRVLINADGINIIAKGINDRNKHLYKVSERVSFYHKGTPQISTRWINRVFRTPLRQNEPDASTGVTSNPVKSRVYHEYTIVEIKSGKVVSSLKIDYVFPPPQPEYLTFRKDIIRENENRPGDNSFYDRKFIKINEDEIKRVNLVNTTFNPLTGLPALLELPSDINDILIRFKALRNDVLSDTYLEYRFATDTSWRTTVKKENPFLILRDLEPGKYKLQVRYPEQDDQVFVYAFEIKPVFNKTTLFKVFAGCFLTAIGFMAFFVVYNRHQNSLIRKEVEHKQQLQIELKALRAQLQPHFIFNALSSIQSLVNKNDIESANLYIAKFGSLLHEILDKSDRTMHPLITEIKQLEDYLQIEQLRFNFHYEIIKDSALNTSEIDIPVMLLQPYVENAIKHGIVEKRTTGSISILVKREQRVLVIIINDNGVGYDSENTRSGYGNTLVTERVSALNRLNPEQSIEVKVESIFNEGTSVIIRFHNWLAP